MNQILELSGNHIIWHRRRADGRRGWWVRCMDRFLGKQRLAVEGSFGRDFYFAHHAPSQRVRKIIWVSLLILVSLKFYVFRELLAGLIMIFGVAVAVSMPLLFLFAVYKTGRNLTQREGFTSGPMSPIRRFPGRDRQLEELLNRLAATQHRANIKSDNPEKPPTQNGLILITELRRRAS